MKERKSARLVFSVRGMDCVTCALAVEKRVGELDGVREVRSATMLDQVFVDYDDAKVGLPEIMEAIKKTGYSGHLVRLEARVREAPTESEDGAPGSA